MLSHPRTARNGNFISSLGMLIAIISTLIIGIDMNWMLIAIGLIIGSIIGAFFALEVQMTQMPQLVAIFNGFGGGASALVACSEFWKFEEGSGTFTLGNKIVSGTYGMISDLKMRIILILPPIQDCVARVLVLKIRTAQSHLSILILDTSPIHKFHTLKMRNQI